MNSRRLDADTSGKCVARWGNGNGGGYGETARTVFWTIRAVTPKHTHQLTGGEP